MDSHVTDNEVYPDIPHIHDIHTKVVECYNIFVNMYRLIKSCLNQTKRKNLHNIKLFLGQRNDSEMSNVKLVAAIYLKK